MLTTGTSSGLRVDFKVALCDFSAGTNECVQLNPPDTKRRSKERVSAWAQGLTKKLHRQDFGESVMNFSNMEAPTRSLPINNFALISIDNEKPSSLQISFKVSTNVSSSRVIKTCRQFCWCGTLKIGHDDATSVHSDSFLLYPKDPDTLNMTNIIEPPPLDLGDNTSAADAGSADAGSTEAFSTDDVSGEACSTDDISADDISTDDVSTDDVSTDNVSTVESHFGAGSAEAFTDISFIDMVGASVADWQSILMTPEISAVAATSCLLGARKDISEDACRVKACSKRGLDLEEYAPWGWMLPASGV